MSCRLNMSSSKLNTVLIGRKSTISKSCFFSKRPDSVVFLWQVIFLIILSKTSSISWGCIPTKAWHTKHGKFWLMIGDQSCKKIKKGEKTPRLHRIVCFRLCLKPFSDSNAVKHYLFLYKTTPFLAMLSLQQLSSALYQVSVEYFFFKVIKKVNHSVSEWSYAANNGGSVKGSGPPWSKTSILT